MKIFCFVSSVSCIVFLIHNYSTNQGSFQNQYELWFLLIMVLGLLFYLFWMPEVSFDKSNLYIKKFNKTEIVSIKNAKSVHNDGKLFRGISSFRIKYLNKNNTLTEVLSLDLPSSQFELLEFLKVFCFDEPTSGQFFHSTILFQVRLLD